MDNILITSLFKEAIPSLIEFEKSDGTRRQMWVTLNDEFLPPRKPKQAPITQDTVKASVPGVVTVYEVGVGWRSFKLENLISIKSFATLESAKANGLTLGE